MDPSIRFALSDDFNVLHRALDRLERDIASMEDDELMEVVQTVAYTCRLFMHKFRERFDIPFGESDELPL